MTTRPEGTQTLPSAQGGQPVEALNVGARGDPFYALYNAFGAVVGLLSADLGAFLWYVDNGSASQGALLGYVAGKAGTDPFGNSFSQGTSFTGTGMVNPMTTAGDIIKGGTGGTPQRLAIGTTGQVLTVTAGAPAWATPTTGFVNPMTTAGDIITGASGGTAQRLAAGAAGQVLGLSGGVPAWITPPSGQFVVVQPSGDTTGNLDKMALLAAVAALPQGGTIYLAAGAFYNNALWTVPAQTTAPSWWPALTPAGNPVCVVGAGPSTIYYPVGSSGGIYYHRTTSYGSQFGNPADPAAGYLRDFIIDGTYATSMAFGLDTGDGRGFHHDLIVQNFDGSGQTGLLIMNRLFWTEKSWFTFQLYNNATACYMGASGTGDHSHEYNLYDFTLFANSNQQGIVIDAGQNQGGSHLRVRGNMAATSSSSGTPTNNIAVLSLIGNDGSGDNSRWYQGQIWIKVEGNQGDGSGSTYPYGLYSDGQGYIKECTGQICHSLTSSNMNNAEFSFSGGISGDSPLAGLAPVQTGVASGSNTGIISSIASWSSPSAGVLDVAATAGFEGTGFLNVAASTNTTAIIAYTGTTSTSFTGCTYISGATGKTVATNNRVAATTSTNPGFPGYGALVENIGPDQMVCVYDAANVTGVTVDGTATGLITGAFFVRAGGSITVNGSGSAPSVYNWIGVGQMTY